MGRSFKKGSKNERQVFHRISSQGSVRISIGIHAVLEVITHFPQRVHKIYLRSHYERHSSLLAINKLALKNKVRIEVHPEGFFHKWGDNHQGVAAELQFLGDTGWNELSELKKGVVLILDGIEDPQNFGAILRTSWLMGVRGILIPKDRSVGLTPSVHKVSCGGVEHVSIWSFSNFYNSISELKDMGFWIWGLSADAPETIYQKRLPEKIAWVLGSEDKGMRKATSQLCDGNLKIPQNNNAASYNVSVAVAMALSESYRQLFYEK